MIYRPLDRVLKLTGKPLPPRSHGVRLTTLRVDDMYTLKDHPLVVNLVHETIETLCLVEKMWSRHDNLEPQCVDDGNVVSKSLRREATIVPEAFDGYDWLLKSRSGESLLEINLRWGMRMKWVIVATIVAFFLLLCFRFLRNLTLGEATIHIAHIKSEEQAHQVATLFRGLQGVVEVRVDLEGHLAKITYRKGRLTVEDMLRALHGAGF